MNSKGQCGGKAFWRLNGNGTLIIAGKKDVGINFFGPSSIWKGNDLKIKKVQIREGITGIETNIFSRCENLTTVEIPSTLVWMDDEFTEDHFPNCNSISFISVAEKNPKYSSDEQGILYDKNKTVMQFAPPTLREITIQDSVKEIKRHDFWPESVERFVVSSNNQFFSADGGVLYSKNGTSLYWIPSCVKSLTIGRNVSFINVNAMMASHLSKIVVSPENELFSSDNQGLLYNKLGDALFFIPSEIKGNVTIPESVVQYSDLIFLMKNNIKISEGNTIFKSDDACAIYTNDMKLLLKAPSCIDVYTIPESVEKIGAYAFVNCRIGSLIMPRLAALLDEDYEEYSDFFDLPFRYHNFDLEELHLPFGTKHCNAYRGMTKNIICDVDESYLVGLDDSDDDYYEDDPNDIDTEFLDLLDEEGPISGGDGSVANESMPAEEEYGDGDSYTEDVMDYGRISTEEERNEAERRHAHRSDRRGDGAQHLRREREHRVLRVQRQLVRRDHEGERQRQPRTGESAGHRL